MIDVGASANNKSYINFISKKRLVPIPDILTRKKKLILNKR